MRRSRRQGHDGKKLYYLDATVDGSVIGGSIMEVVYLPADGNLDGKVSLADYNWIAINYLKTDVTYLEGDYNLDGKVSMPDFQILSMNYLQTLGGGGGTGVPEPAMIGLWVLGVGLWAAKRSSVLGLRGSDLWLLIADC